MIDRHHLLECILWPNGDGTFRKIINTYKRLDKLGVYKDYKLTIPIDHSIHQTMHREFKKGTEYSMEGENNPMFGVKGKNHPGSMRIGEKNPMYGRTGEKNPWYGKGYLMTGNKNPNWKGDKLKPSTMYVRALKRYKRGEITEEELKKFRDLRNEFKERKLECQH